MDTRSEEAGMPPNHRRQSIRTHLQSRKVPRLFRDYRAGKCPVSSVTAAPEEHGRGGGSTAPRNRMRVCAPAIWDTWLLAYSQRATEQGGEEHAAPLLFHLGRQTPRLPRPPPGPAHLRRVPPQRGRAAPIIYSSLVGGKAPRSGCGIPASACSGGVACFSVFFCVGGSGAKNMRRTHLFY